MINDPRISIIVPCYNSEKYIIPCLESIKNQTYTNIEVIVIDNESKDNTYNIIKEYKQDFIIDTVKNIYPRCWDEVRNKALTIYTGDYFTLLASDDLIQNNYIKKCAEYIKANIPLAFNSPIKGFQIKNNKNIIINTAQYYYNTINELKRNLLTQCCVNTPSVFYSKKLQELNLLKTEPKTYSGAADYDLYCNIVDNNVFIERTQDWLGYYYRWHPDQATWQMRKDNINYDLLIQNKWREKWT
jgi:glycosyltransferase involved in cell wall biosynthesis